MNKVLQILDEMEAIREKAEKRPEHYPVDYTIRLLEAVVADAYGFEDRNEWTHKLKEFPESKYSKRYYGKEEKPWKIWFEKFDVNGEKIGAGVYVTDYKYKQNAVRAAKIRFSKKGYQWTVSRDNPFIIKMQ